MLLPWLRSLLRASYILENIAQENRELKNEVLAHRSQLEELSKSPRSHLDPSPARDTLTEGLERVLRQSQYDSLCEFLAEQVLCAVRMGKEFSPVPFLPSDVPGAFLPIRTSGLN